MLQYFWKKLFKNPLKVFEYGFFPKVTTSPNNVYITIYTRAIIAVYSTIFLSFFLFNIVLVEFKHIIIKRINQKIGLIIFVVMELYKIIRYHKK
mgnify:CR=1 FL=1